MSIQIGDNLSYYGKKFNFQRDSFATLSEMKSFDENYIPEKGFKAYCAETDKYYVFSVTNEIDLEIGKWREYKEILDSLDSSDSAKALSANQGRILKENIDLKEDAYNKDQPNGYAGLDSNGKLPIEKTYGATATVVDVATYESLPATGVNGVIYYVLNTGTQYKWSGSVYIDITEGEDNAKKNETSIFDCSNGTSTKYYSSLLEAINVVPPAYRTSNRIISYLSTENSPTSAVNYQYNGVDSTTWANLTKWERIPNQADLTELRSKTDKIGFWAVNDKYIRAYTDNQGKLLFGIKKDGSIEWSLGVPTPIEKRLEEITAILQEYFEEDNEREDAILQAIALIDEKIKDFSSTFSDKYISATIDKNNAIIECITSELEKVFYIPLVVQGNKLHSVDVPNYIKAITDKQGKLLCAITNEGYFFVSAFDKQTQKKITDFVDDNAIGNYHRIPELNNTFDTRLPYSVYNADKGNPSAKYKFNIPLKEEFNIRFKFKVLSNILNTQKTPTICKMGDVSIKASCKKPYQYSQSIMVGSESKTSIYPTLVGGVGYLNTGRKIGDFAFSVKYVGSGTDAYIENDGVGIVITVNGGNTRYNFNEYKTLLSLYTALSSNPNLEVAFKEIEGHTTDELAIFDRCSLVGTFYNIDTLETYADQSAPFFVPYAIDNKWHQVEIVQQNGYIYYNVDGCQCEVKSSIGVYPLELGGECDITFKDIEISTDSVLDAEICNMDIVSSVSPSLVIFEGHGMFDMPSELLDNSNYVSQQGMGTSCDRLNVIFRYMLSKGYVPISFNDVCDYFNNGKILSKRCFTICCDDYRWDNCLNIKNRRAFTEFGVHPALAIIYSNNQDITFNGEIISKKEAAEICLRNNFDLLSHIDHSRMTSINPSILLDKIISYVQNCDKILVDGMIIVYPYGSTNNYIMDCFKWLGVRLGVGTEGTSNIYNNPLSVNKYNLTRIDVGSRTSMESIISKIL